MLCYVCMYVCMYIYSYIALHNLHICVSNEQLDDLDEHNSTKCLNIMGFSVISKYKALIPIIHRDFWS